MDAGEILDRYHAEIAAALAEVRLEIAINQVHEWWDGKYE